MSNNRTKTTKAPCNWAVNKETVAETGEARSTVRSITDFTLGFVAEQIKGETFEVVQLPGFGKFRPRYQYISAKKQRKGQSAIERQRRQL